MSQPDDLGAYRIRRLLRQYDTTRPVVWANVRRRLRGLHLPEHEFDSIYNHAWFVLVDRVKQGQQIREPVAWLTAVACNQTFNYLRATHAVQEVLTGEINGLHKCGEDLWENVERRERLGPVYEALRDGYNATETQILYYVIIERCSCRDIATRLGVSQKYVSRLLYGDAGRTGLKERFAHSLARITKGRWCDDQASLLAAYELGWFAPGSSKDLQARLHLRHCPSCRNAAWQSKGRRLAAHRCRPRRKRPGDTKPE